MNAFVQEIITYLIITLTAVYTLYKMILFFIPSKNKSYCSSCSGGACGLKNHQISNSAKKKRQFQIVRQEI